MDEKQKVKVLSIVDLAASLGEFVTFHKSSDEIVCDLAGNDEENYNFSLDAAVAELCARALERIDKKAAEMEKASLAIENLHDLIESAPGKTFKPKTL